MTTDARAAATAALIEAVDSGVADGTTPGAACVVLAGDERRFVSCTGTLHRGDKSPAVDVDTVYDLASLTKLLSTTVLFARAVDDNRLALDEQPWPRWPGVTIEHVLRHESGLPAWRPLFEEARKKGVVGLPAGKAVVVDAACATELEAAPGTRTLYSDVGFIALGALLEERLGCTIDVAFAALPFVSGTGLRFVRLDKDGFHPSLPLVAPTERCPWRRRAIHGQVHDDNCFAMGGVSGHAGLFGSLRDVEHAAQWLRRLPGRLATFAAVPAPPKRRPIGFDRTTTPGGTTGDTLSPQTVGHLAFTGCSLWIDPVDDAVYVLLTNRVHESRENGHAMRALRRRFHQAAASWVRAR